MSAFNENRNFSGYYSKTLHGAFNEHQNTLNGYHLAGRGDNDIGKFSLNGRGDNDIGPYSLHGYHLSGRGDNDIGPYSLHGHIHSNRFSLNGDTPDEGYSRMTLIGVGVGALVLGAATGYLLSRKK